MCAAYIAFCSLNNMLCTWEERGEIVKIYKLKRQKKAYCVECLQQKSWATPKSVYGTSYKDLATQNSRKSLDIRSSSALSIFSCYRGCCSKSIKRKGKFSCKCARYFTRSAFAVLYEPQDSALCSWNVSVSVPVCPDVASRWYRITPNEVVIRYDEDDNWPLRILWMDKSNFPLAGNVIRRTVYSRQIIIPWWFCTSITRRQIDCVERHKKHLHLRHILFWRGYCCRSTNVYGNDNSLYSNFDYSRAFYRFSLYFI